MTRAPKGTSPQFLSLHPHRPPPASQAQPRFTGLRLPCPAGGRKACWPPRTPEPLGSAHLSVGEGRGARGEGLGRPRAPADLAVLDGRVADKRQPVSSDRRSGAGTCQHFCPPAHIKEGPAGLQDTGQAPPRPTGGCRTLPLRRAARLGAPESCCLIQPGWPSFPGQGGGLQTQRMVCTQRPGTQDLICAPWDTLALQPWPSSQASWSCFYIQETGNVDGEPSAQSFPSCAAVQPLMDRSTPGLPVRHQFPELAQTHVHRVGDAIQPSHPLLPLSSCLQSCPLQGLSQ